MSNGLLRIDLYSTDLNKSSTIQIDFIYVNWLQIVDAGFSVYLIVIKPFLAFELWTKTFTDNILEAVIL